MISGPKIGTIIEIVIGRRLTLGTAHKQCGGTASSKRRTLVVVVETQLQLRAGRRVASVFLPPKTFKTFVIVDASKKRDVVCTYYKVL